MSWIIENRRERAPCPERWMCTKSPFLVSSVIFLNDSRVFSYIGYLTLSAFPIFDPGRGENFNILINSRWCLVWRCHLTSITSFMHPFRSGNAILTRASPSIYKLTPVKRANLLWATSDVAGLKKIESEFHKNMLKRDRTTLVIVINVEARALSC